MAIKLTKVMEIWDELHAQDTGDIGFCDLEQAIEKVVGVENDVPSVPLPKQLNKIGGD